MTKEKFGYLGTMNTGPEVGDVREVLLQRIFSFVIVLVFLGMVGYLTLQNISDTPSPATGKNISTETVLTPALYWYDNEKLDFSMLLPYTSDSPMATEIQAVETGSTTIQVIMRRDRKEIDWQNTIYIADVPNEAALKSFLDQHFGSGHETKFANGECTLQIDRTLSTTDITVTGPSVCHEIGDFVFIKWQPHVNDDGGRVAVWPRHNGGSGLVHEVTRGSDVTYFDYDSIMAASFRFRDHF